MFKNIIYKYINFTDKNSKSRFTYHLMQSKLQIQERCKKISFSSLVLLFKNLSLNFNHHKKLVSTNLNRKTEIKLNEKRQHYIQLFIHGYFAFEIINYIKKKLVNK